MGIYLNPGAKAFQEAINSEIYVDKTAMIYILNTLLNTQQKYVCVSRPRRFGKSMAANMISAYYDCTVDPKVFDGLKVSTQDGMKYQGAYDVVHINMQEFLSRKHDMTDMVAFLNRSVIWDLKGKYAEVRYFDDSDMIRSMQDIYDQTGQLFVIVIDEWDCIFREKKNDTEAQKQYLDFLRDWLKDKTYIALVYMTGILPIKKYGTHSALNMFAEYSMEDPDILSEFTGFTQKEVRELCDKYSMNYDDCEYWYDGYVFPSCGHIYNPKSIVSAMLSRKYKDYWNETETFEALRIYIDMNMEGLREKVEALMAGDRIRTDVSHFQNDMTTFESADDVLTLLIHLGYLGFDDESFSVYIPNHEIQMEYRKAMSRDKWNSVLTAIDNSFELLQRTWSLDADGVAKGIERAHQETSHLQYNDENALAYTVSLAYYAAREYYTVVRELPSGKGFADLTFIPRKKFPDKPALVVELKWNKSAEGAIKQIREKRYTDALEEYSGNILLVGINYNRKTKHHTCTIEEMKKNT